MAELPKSRGRGAAIREALLRAQAEASVLDQSVGETRPRGRGALLEKLKAREASAQSRPGGEPTAAAATEDEPAPKPRAGTGRAAMLKKFQEMRVGGTPSPAAPAARATYEPEKKEEEEEEQPPCKFMGQAGSQVHMTANYIRLTIDQDKGVFEYEVIFSQEIDSKNVRIKTLNSQLSKLGGVKSFDGGSCLYLPIKLPEIDTHLECVHPVDGSPLTMTVRYKKQKRMKDCLHLFNVLFKRIMRTLLMFEFNRNFFDLKSAISIPQYKLEVLPGFAVTCDEFDGGLMLCLDAQHRMLRTQTVYDLLLELKRLPKDKFKEEVYKLVLGCSVLTRYNTKNYVIDEIMWDATPRDTFSTSSGDEISYMDYYKKQYNIEIRDPNQPLLLNKKKLRKGGQEEERLVCLVPELCHLTGLTDSMRADYKIMASVAQYTRLTPAQRMRALQVYQKRVNDNPEAKKILSDWGLRIADATIDLNARVLDPERIIFGNSEITVGAKMDWGMDMGRSTVCHPVDLTNWALIYTERDRNCATEFVQVMKRIGQPMGCNIQQPILNGIPNDRTATVVQKINSIVDPALQCIVIICPTQRQDLYNAIKKICCVQQPIASQVILSRTLSKPQRLRAIVQKIALQINCKLGGSLWTLHIPAKRWMVCGIDTYHSAGQDYSWFGFVGTLNDSFSRYYSTAVKQMREMGDNLKLCLTKQLVKYREINGYYPNQIIVFRDGVGDGQLETCKNHEVKQIEDCLLSMDIKSELCFVVVQKRINTRMFAKVNGGLENPRPGSILDHTITKRGMCDFYLVSQHVGQGTVSPTHYICLHNTANLKPDIVQKLAYKLCHLYYNWSGTIRVPAPCQYAHKLAYLVGNCIQSTPDEKLSTRLYYL